MTSVSSVSCSCSGNYLLRRQVFYSLIEPGVTVSPKERLTRTTYFSSSVNMDSVFQVSFVWPSVQPLTEEHCHRLRTFVKTFTGE